MKCVAPGTATNRIRFLMAKGFRGGCGRNSAFSMPRRRRHGKQAKRPLCVKEIQRPVRTRHSAVRILSAQPPATCVSPYRFPAFGKRSTFPTVSGQAGCLCRGKSAISDPRARFSKRVSARQIFNIRKPDHRLLRRPVGFWRRQVRMSDRSKSRSALRPLPLKETAPLTEWSPSHGRA
jgi:hypothetical protein